MKKILLSSTIVLAVAAVAGFATYSYFSDTETSTGNTFSSGTLDLAVDSNNGVNTVKFTVGNMKPGDQPIGTWKLHNAGTVNGYIDLENILVTSHENGCVEPETEAGDSTCASPGDGLGELQDVVYLSKLFWDNDCDGWVDSGEGTIYDGKAGLIASHYETDKALNAGADQCVTAQFNWWTTLDDNKAQGDSFDFNVDFQLAQTTAQ